MSLLDVKEDDRLLQGIRKVLDLSDELIALPTIDQICKFAVEYARTELGVERCGLFLWDGKSETAQGTYGTNMRGETTDERAYKLTAAPYFPRKRNPGEARWTIIEAEYQSPTDCGDKTFGWGWHASTLIQTPNQIIGVFCNDTAVTRTAFDPILQEIITCYCSILATIIIHKNAEIEKFESESKYRLLFQNNPQIMYMYDLDTHRILDVNNVMVDTYGYRRAEFLNLRLEDMAPHRTPEELTSQVEILRTKGHWMGTLEHVKKDGSLNYVQINANVIDFNGKKVGLSQAVDITEHQNARENIDRLAAFVKFNPNPVLEIDHTGKVLFVNAATDQLCESLQISSIDPILPKETPSIVAKCLESAKPQLRIETKVNDRTFSWSYFPVPGRKTIHCYGGEITERIKLEEQFRQAQKMESIGRLAGGVAHDFNNILTAILGYSNLIKMRTDVNPDVLAEVDQITLAAQRAANLTRQLLAFSRRQYVTLSNVDLNHSVRNIERMLRTLMGEDIHIECKLKQEIPAVRADLNMLDQVILNLAVNARDAMPEGGTLTISTEMAHVSTSRTRSNPDASEGTFVKLSVSDTGMGMEDSVKAKIFEPFFTTKGQGKGTGLGLSTVYGIVRQHQGWIDVQSTLGRGTSFEVYLPPSKDEASKIVEQKSSDKIDSGCKGTILIVEDEAAVRNIAKVILERQGCKVIEVETALRALQKWDEIGDEVDVLLTDMVMPDSISGRELAVRLLKLKPGLRIIFSSGYSQELSLTNPEEFPQSQFLAKPYSSNELVRAIQTALVK